MQFFHYIIEHWAGIGTGTAAILVVLLQQWNDHRKTSNSIKKLDAKIEAFDNRAMMGAIGRNINRQIDGLDPETYLTFGYIMPDETILDLPLIPHRIVNLTNNLTIQWRYHDKDSTGYKLLSNGPAELRRHAHFCDEMVRVLEGAIVNTQTGERYGVGKEWTIKKGEFHSCFIEPGSDINGTFIPALPKASTRPVNTRGIEKGYDFGPYKAPSVKAVV